MRTTIEFLDAVKARHHLQSDYALAGKLGLSRSSISKFRVGKDFLGDSTAIQVAALLEIEPAYVVASVHRERAKKADEQALWESIMQKLGGAAAALALCLGGMAVPEASYAATSGQAHLTDASQYTLCDAIEIHEDRKNRCRWG